jgi:hypothetical protein
MELIVLSALFSSTFRARTKELFLGRAPEPFENQVDETITSLKQQLKKISKSLSAPDEEADAEKPKVSKAKDEDEPEEEDKAAEKKEVPEHFETKDTEPLGKTGKIFLILFLVISGLVGLYAAYLSWKANTIFEMSTAWKVVFAFFAFLGGISYLLSYIVYRWKETEYVVKMRKCDGSPAGSQEIDTTSIPPLFAATAAAAAASAPAEPMSPENDATFASAEPKKEQFGGRRKSRARVVRKPRKK